MRTEDDINKEIIDSRLRLAVTADIPFDRLEAICTAEKENRCVVLPCKVGDTVAVGVTYADKVSV